MDTVIQRFFYPLLGAALLADTACFMIFHAPIVYSALCIYAVALVYAVPTTRSAVFASVILGLESLLFFDQFALPLLYIAPLTLLAIGMQRTFFATRWLPPVYLMLCLGIQLLLETVILARPFSMPYTKQIVVVNIILVMIFSLTLSRGNQDNRSEIQF
jgi:hypothetical protein